MSYNIEQVVARVIKKEQEWQEKIRKKRFRYRLVLGSAVLILIVSSLYSYKEIVIPEQKYETARSLLEQQDYQGAIEIFESLGTYSDSEDMILEVKYVMGEDKYLDGDLQGARMIFESITDYKDSSSKIIKIDELLQDEKYCSAVDFYEASNYEDALSLFKELDGYKDSSNYIYLIHNEYQQRFLNVLKNTLKQREAYTVYNTKMSFEDLLKTEDPILSYQDASFQDEFLTELKNKYIDGVLLQKDALTYFDTDKKLFANKWQEGYFIRIQSIQEMYESGYTVIDEETYKEIVLEILQNRVSASMANAPVSIGEDGTMYIVAFSCINDTRLSFKNLEIRCTWNGKYVTKETIKEWNSFQAISEQWKVPISEVGNNSLTYDVELLCK